MLKGSSLFYFSDRKAPHKATKVQGFIPVRGAQVAWKPRILRGVGWWARCRRARNWHARHAALGKGVRHLRGGQGSVNPDRTSTYPGLLPPSSSLQLEAAKIETELPPGLKSTAGPYKGAQFFITITVHSSFAFSCEHPFWVLAAPSQEVQMAWVNACWQVGASEGGQGVAGPPGCTCLAPGGHCGVRLPSAPQGHMPAGVGHALPPPGKRAAPPLPRSLVTNRPPLLPPSRAPWPIWLQAAIPRTDLIQVLEKAGKLADVLGSYAQGVQVRAAAPACTHMP